MITMLRAPQAIPSMFSQDIDFDDHAMGGESFARRWMIGRAKCRGSRGRTSDSAANRWIPALVGPSMIVAVLGNPVLKAALLAAGTALIK